MTLTLQSIDNMTSWSFESFSSSLATAPVIGVPSGGSGTTATTTSAPTSGGGIPPQQQQSPFNGSFMILMLGVFVFMILMTTMSGRKEKKRRAQMLSDLGRYDRVQTAGGIIGTVVELHDDEVTLKVDESTNTKIRFSRSAVQAVLKKGSESRSESAEPVGASA